MARGRMVNKKISNDKRVNDMPLQAQLLFTWLIPHLDCNGCFYGSAQMVKSLVIPRKNWSKKLVEKCLTVMENSKNNEGTPLIFRYAVNSEQYLFMTGFASEQTGLRYDKEKPEFPTFDGKNTEMILKKSARTEQEVEVEVETKQEVEDKEKTKQKESSVRFLKSIEEVIVLYQENVLLGATVSEDMETELETACGWYSPDWVYDAIGEAIAQNQPHWRYIVGILRNWSKYGKKAG